jgi:hypothetical protein
MMLASRAFLYFPLQLSSGVSQTHAHSWLCFVARESSRRFYRFRRCGRVAADRAW